MEEANPDESNLRFGVFDVDLRSGELRKGGVRIKVQEVPFKVLTELLEHPGEVVTREELRKHIWPNETFGDFDHAVNVAVGKLRAALGDSAETPQMIETLPRRGYRFIAPVNRGRQNGARLPGTIVSGEPWSHKWVAAVVLTSVVVLAGTLFWINRRVLHERGPNLQTMQPTRLTDSGSASYVAISPDGRYVVYALGGGEKLSLWLRQVAQPSGVQVLPPAAVDFQGLAFSPDENYLYFVRSAENNPIYKSLYSMPVLGGPAHLLINDVDCAPSFSPDGRQFVFTRATPSRNVTEVLIANADGSGEHVFASFSNAHPAYNPGATWSPDGKTIAIPLMLMGGQVRWVLYTVRFPEAKSRELYSSHGAIGRAMWLPDGNSLLVPLGEPYSSHVQLWTISHPEGKALRLTNDLSNYDLAIDLTKDGKTLAATVSTRFSNVWMAPSTQLAAARQITFGETPKTSPAEDADGRILWQSSDGKLWRMKADGTQRESFVEKHTPVWFEACGRQVVFASFEDGQLRLMRVDSDGTNLTKLVSGNLWISTCSTDGAFVYFINSVAPQKIWRVPISGGVPQAISYVPGEVSIDRISVSPDGKFLAYMYSTATPLAWTLAVISAQGGPPIRRYATRGGIFQVRWAPDGAGLQYLLTQDGVTNIWEQPISGEAPKQLTNFTAGLIFDYSWSADHKQLLLARGSVSSDVVLIRNLR